MKQDRLQHSLEKRAMNGFIMKVYIILPRQSIQYELLAATSIKRSDT